MIKPDANQGTEGGSRRRRLTVVGVVGWLIILIWPAWVVQAVLMIAGDYGRGAGSARGVSMNKVAWLRMALAAAAPLCGVFAAKVVRGGRRSVLRTVISLVVGVAVFLLLFWTSCAIR